MIRGLDHVQIAAPRGCEADARRFYGDLLGMREIPKPEALRARGGVWFTCGDGRELHVGVEDPFSPARKAHPCLIAEDAGALAERLDDVAWDENIPGTRRFYTTDPFGNRLEIRAA
jgi:catechol 2,3-dioxygenase-like lactoylglutathione lyase family enzyme